MHASHAIYTQYIFKTKNQMYKKIRGDDKNIISSSKQLFIKKKKPENDIKTKTY